jgi:hypothetical protein
MQRFRFRLERVLRWQTDVCALEEAALRECLLALARADDQVAHLKAEILATEQEWLHRPTLAAGDLRALAAYRTEGRRRLNLLGAEQRTRAEAADRQRQKLVDARRRLHIMERIRARAWAEYTATLDREFDALALECHLSKGVADAGIRITAGLNIRAGTGTGESTQ